MSRFCPASTLLAAALSPLPSAWPAESGKGEKKKKKKKKELADFICSDKWPFVSAAFQLLMSVTAEKHCLLHV